MPARRARRSGTASVSIALPHAEQLYEKLNAARRPLPRPLEVIVELRILELMEVERCGVLHDSNADPIREHVAEESSIMPEVRASSSPTTIAPISIAASAQRCCVGPWVRAEQNNFVDDQLGHPEIGDRNHSSVSGAAGSSRPRTSAVVSQTSRIKRGTKRSAAICSRNRGRGVFGSRRLPIMIGCVIPRKLRTGLARRVAVILRADDEAPALRAQAT